MASEMIEYPFYCIFQISDDVLKLFTSTMSSCVCHLLLFPTYIIKHSPGSPPYTKIEELVTSFQIVLEDSSLIIRDDPK